MREEFIKKWQALEFGIKTRVFKKHSQSIIEYILKTPKYSNVNKMEEIMNDMDKCVDEFLNDVQKMIENFKQTK